MTTLTESDFLAWADGAGLCLDSQYPHSAVLTFRSDLPPHRFWEVPSEPERRPHFISSLLERMGDWRSCYVWRYLGMWPASADPARINDLVEFTMLGALGLPLGTRDVVRFERSELGQLVTLIFATTIFAGSVWEDIHVVPDHARCFLKTDHHHVIHVSFRNPSDVDVWVLHMQERGFRLPSDVPDPTFKRPHWMDDDA